MEKLMSIAEFLLARIAEDEAAARAVEPLGHNWDMGGNRQDQRFYTARIGYRGEDGARYTIPDTAARDHFARWNPARVLAECEAKRRIVEECGEQVEETGTSGSVVAYRVLRALTLPYVDHPDFDPEWKL